MSKGITYLDAAELVLRETQHSMSAQELIDEIRKRQLIIKITGKTPLKTMHAKISVDIKNKKENSRFKRVSKGKFVLRELSSDEEYFAIPHKKRMSRLDSVLVFETKKLDELGHFHGIQKNYKKYQDGLLSFDTSFFKNRLQAEKDDRYKQIVSYVIIKYKNSLLRFTRGVITNIGQYLHGEYSIGFGGHVEDKDAEPLFKTDLGYLNSVYRELKQEINISVEKLPKYSFQVIGVLNDDSSDLGRHHFAFIHLLELFKLPDDETVKKGEKSINGLQFVEFSEISKEFGGYEYWSKLCLQTFFSNELSFECHVHPKLDFSLRNHKDIILVVGYIGSGKTEACNLLCKEFGYTLVPCSKVMQHEMGCESIEIIGRQKLQEIGLNFINSPDGHERLARAIIKFMENNPSTNYVLDGLRYPKTLEVLKMMLGKSITVIYAESTIDNLHKYFSSRENSGYGVGTFTEFLKIVYHPVEREIERFLPIADITIYNHASKKDYLESLRNYFAEEFGSIL